MKTVLVISNSAERTEYDLERSINTIKGYGMDPLAVMPAIFETDGTSESFDVSEMLDYVFNECDASALSIGYITDPDVYLNIADRIKSKPGLPVVIRPSVISETGSILVDEDTFYTLQDEVLPLASFIVVNCLEAELLSGLECPTKAHFNRAAKMIYNTYGCQVMILKGPKTDDETLIFTGDNISWLPNPGKEDPSMKSDISTAVACGLADGDPIAQAARRAFEYVYGQIPVKRESVPVTVPSINRTAVPTLSAFSFSLKTPSGSDKNEENKDDTAPAAEDKAEPDPAPAADHVADESVSMEEAVKPVATSSSLVSPAKSLRDMARRIDVDRHVQPPEDHRGVTSTIKEALVANRSDAVPKTPKLEVPTTKSSTDIQALKDRLSRLSGEG